MDFFDLNAPHARSSTTIDATGFAEALQQRAEVFAMPTPSPKMVQALNRPAVPTTVRPSARRLPSKPLPPVSTAFAPIQPEELSTLLSSPATLVIDIRPHGQWWNAHLRGAINLAVPSTLLRRPNFSLDKLASMLPDVHTRQNFNKWRSAQVIIVCDADTTALPESSNIVSLLTKLKAAEAPATRMGYLYGGITSSLLSAIPDYIEVGKEDDEDTPPEDTSSTHFLSVRQLSMSAFQQGSTTNAAQRPTITKVDAAEGAPGPTTTRVTASNPFYDNIRQHMELAGGITDKIPLYIPKKILMRSGELPFDWLREITEWAGVIGANGPRLGGGIATVAGDVPLGRIRVKGNVMEGMEALAMQFYRIELGEQRRLQGVMDQHSRESGGRMDGRETLAAALLGGADKVGIFSPRPPPSERSMKSRNTGLAHSSNIRHHKQGKDDEPEYFPFSITAGIEKGAKNRYRNIWPFDHARVRLQSNGLNIDGDYINASYIQPKGTNRHYIATQGPLPSTYNDFWMLVWEQSVRILVMLTKRTEGQSVKCGLYWKNGKYGSLNLKLVREEGGVAGERAEENFEGEVPFGGFNFPVASNVTESRARRAKVDMHRQVGNDLDGSSVTGLTTDSDCNDSTDEEDDSIIRRKFLLWHDDDPTHPRTVVQFQYVGWPDLNVPTTPKYLLKLINEINVLYEEYSATGIIGADEADISAGHTTSDSRTASHLASRRTNATVDVPESRRNSASEILVHCSAGVGRTGSFVLIDAVLDAVRRETVARSTKVVDGDDPEAAHRSLDVIDGSSAAGFAVPLPIRTFSLNSTTMSNTSSLGLPADMEHLSMQSSPPKPSFMSGHSVGTPDPGFASPPPSSRMGGPLAPNLLQRRLASASNVGTTLASTGLVNTGTTIFSSSSVAGNARARASAITFDHMVPRQISIPRHSRAHHHASQVARVMVEKEEARLKRGKLSKAQPKLPTVESGDEAGDSSSDEPSPLSALDEPVRQVLEGMREQRMSMCQSLRQYVFVHRAIVEGAIQIVDQLNNEQQVNTGVSDNPSLPSPAKMDISVPHTPNVAPSSAFFHPETSTSSFSRNDSVFNLGSLPPPPSSTDFLATSVLGSKRLASPTELLRTDIRGDHTISKRPSLKRIDKSHGLTTSTVPGGSIPPP